MTYQTPSFRGRRKGCPGWCGWRGGPMAPTADGVRARPEGPAQPRPWLREEALAVRLGGLGLPIQDRRRYLCALDRALFHAEGARLAPGRAPARAEAESAGRGIA